MWGSLFPLFPLAWAEEGLTECNSTPDTRLFSHAITVTSSNLPIVVIDTGGKEIPDEPKIPARMRVFYRGPGEINRITDPNPQYDGWIGIEVRGRSSFWFPQKPYGIETRDALGHNLNVSLLDLPPENDWILLSNYNDKSFCRNLLAFELFRRMGHYAPRGRLCEVIVNGAYRGIYVFTEKIKPDKNRVPIAKLTPQDNEGMAVTGGYLISVDYVTPGGSWVSDYPPFYYPNRKVRYNYVYPEPDEITPAQKAYIRGFIRAAEGALYGSAFRDPHLGYRAYVDVPSFIDYFLLGEVSRNVDAYKKSRYFYKDRDDRDGLLHAGPVWDFDWAWKNIRECIFGNTDGSGWGYPNNDCDPSYAVPDWYVRMLQDRWFTERVISRYQELRKGVLDLRRIEMVIDSIAQRVDQAKNRHFSLWPIWTPNPAPEVEPPSRSYEEEIARLKAWIRKRMAWLDLNIPRLMDQTLPEETPEAIPLVNPGFEEPGIGKIKGWDGPGSCLDPTWNGATEDIPGWQSDDPVWDSGVESGWGASEGDYTAFLMGRDPAVYQVTSERFQPGDQLLLRVDAKNNWRADRLEMALFYGAGKTHTVVATKTVSVTDVMVDYELFFDINERPDGLSWPMGILFKNVSTEAESWIGLDRVRLFRLPRSEVKQGPLSGTSRIVIRNYPNPFQSATKIRFEGELSGPIRLTIYDPRGREVITQTFDGEGGGTIREIPFEAVGFPSGIYLCLLQTQNDSAVIKMVCIH